MPAHLFVSSVDGALYDTRVPNWADTPLRADFSRHARVIPKGIKGTTLVRASLRAGGAAWPGGYALYFLTDDGQALSFAAVRENLTRVLDAVLHGQNDGWRVVGLASTEGDDEPTYCAHTGEVIE